MLKNMMLYRITSNESILLLNDHVELDEKLSEFPARLPEGSQWRQFGFTDPGDSARPDDPSMVWSGPNNITLLTVTFHDRQLTAATVREHVQGRVAKIEEREQRKIYRKEWAQIRDEVEAELLPRAFIKHSHVDILVAGDLLIVGTSSAKKADDCLGVLRDAMESLNVKPLTLKVGGGEVTTRIARDNLVPGFNRGDQVKLVDAEKNAVTFKGVDLGEDEPQTYMEQGFHAAELLIESADMQFKLTDQLVFKSIKFADGTFDEVKADSDGDPAALIDGNLLIFTHNVGKVVGHLTEGFGEDIPKRITGTRDDAGVLDGLLAPIKNGGELYINDELVASVSPGDDEFDEFEEDDDI